MVMRKKLIAMIMGVLAIMSTLLFTQASPASAAVPPDGKYGPYSTTFTCNPQGYIQSSGGGVSGPLAIKIGNVAITVRYWYQVVDGTTFYYLTNGGGEMSVYNSNTSPWSSPVSVYNSTNTGTRQGLTAGTAWGQASGPIAVFVDQVSWQSGAGSVFAQAYDAVGADTDNVNSRYALGRAITVPGKTTAMHANGLGYSDYITYYNGSVWQNETSPDWVFVPTVSRGGTYTFDTNISASVNPRVTVRYIASVQTSVPYGVPRTDRIIFWCNVPL